MGLEAFHESRGRAGAVAALSFMIVLGLLSAALLAGPVAAGTKYTTLTQFEGGANSTAIAFNSCQSTSNGTKVKLPFDANVSSASLTISASTNASNNSNWVSADIGDDGSVEANLTLNGSTYAEMPLGGAGFNNFTAASGKTSGNNSIPLLFSSCAPAGGWTITFYNLSVTYLQTIPANTSAPTFSGPIANMSMRANTSQPYAVYLPYYFSDADNDTLNYTIVKQNASDSGWSNVSAAVGAPWIALNATNSWTGNLTFRIDGTDPANLTASSNNITLEVYTNRAPVFGGGNGTVTIANQTVTVDMTVARYVNLWSYFSDPDFNDTMDFSVDQEDPTDPGWANVTINASGGVFIFNSTNGWIGNLTFRVRATDGAGAFAVSNVVKLRVKPNEAPVSDTALPNLTVDRNSVSFAGLGNLSEPDGEPMTVNFIKGDPNATGWAYITVNGTNGSANLTFGFYVWSGNWSGTVSGFLRATDPGGRSSDSNTFDITVNARPFLNASIPDQTIVRGTTSWALVNLTLYLSDREGDPLTHTVFRQTCCNNSTTMVSVIVNGSFLDIGSTSPTWTGTESFYVRACDGLGRCEWSNIFNVVVTVAPNRAPRFNGTVGDLFVIQGRVNYSAINLALFFSDPDGDSLTLGFSQSDPNATGWSYASILWNGTSIDIRSTDLTWLGDLNIAFWARDTSNVYVWSNNLTLHVVARNLIPTFRGPIGDLLMLAGTTSTGILDANDYFSDPNGGPLTYTIVSPSASDGWNYTTVSMNGSLLDLTNDDTDGWVGTVCFVIRATDANNTSAESNEICLDVLAPANGPPAPVQPLPTLHAPAGVNATLPIDLALFFTDDRYVDQLTFTVVPGPEPEWSAVNLSTQGSLLTVDFVAPVAPVTLTFRVLVTDLRGATYTSAPVTLFIDAKPDNRAPQLAGPASATLVVGTPLEVSLQAFDDDGDALVWRVFPSSAGIQASVDPATQKLRLYAPTLDERASFAVTVQVADGWGAGATLTLPLRVWNPSIVPVVGLELSANRSGWLWINGTVAVGVQPPGAPPPSVSIRVDGGAPLFGSLVSGSFHFLFPSTLAPGAHPVVVSITDGYGRVGAATQTVTVPAPPPPLPTLVGILYNGRAPTEMGFNTSLTFVLETAAPVARGITLRWFLDGVEVGNGSFVTGLRPPPGPHTVEARASNGEEERSSSATFTVLMPPAPAPASAGALFNWFWIGLAAGLGLAAFGAFVAGTEVGRYFLAWTLFGSVFARLKRESLLDHFVRGRLYQIICDEPGIHLAELRRRTNIGHGTAIHHLRVLEKGEYIRVLAEGTHTRFYPTDRKLAEEEYGLSDSDRAVLSVVAGAPGISPGELSSKLERSQSTVSRSISRLQTLGYVTTEQAGRSVAVYPRPGAQVPRDDLPEWARDGG